MRRFRILVFVTALSLAVGASAVPVAAGRSSGAPLLPPRTRVSVHDETGAVRFIGSAPGRPIPRPEGVGPSASPARVARAFLDETGNRFGLRDQREELRVRSVRPAPAGRSVIRFQQVHDGVRILGGELVVNLDANGNVLSASGEVLPAPKTPVRPSVTARDAMQTAIGAVAKTRGSEADLNATAPRLWIYDSRILGGPGPDVPILVWRMDVRGPGPVDELVLVDARLGNVVLRIDQIEEARDRRVCDAGNTSAQYPCVSPVRIETDPATGNTDVDNAFDFAGDTYDFFFDSFGRDSLDDAGMILFSTVRYCDPMAPCPYQNAFWDGAQMVYGTGFAVDDVVGHELTHGVTEFTNHLFYYYQSGAINESLSDVFGEFVDLTNTAGTDTAATRWLLGEDIPGIGAIRDMENPPAFDDPDRMTSPNYTADVNEVDGGGVHTNSGVNNKAAFLITDGGTFNGQTVTGVGISKAARIYYEVATNMLTSASDYADLSTALPQACTNLIGVMGISAADCTEVSEAVIAVEMDQEPPAAPNPEAPVCPVDSPLPLFFDNLEDTASGNWMLQTANPPNRWFYPQNPNPFSFDATFATSGSTNFWGYNESTVADYSIAMTSDVALPIGSAPFLRFNHAYGFEDGPGAAFDGGVVEYSTTTGASWVDAGSLFTHGGYNGTISPAFTNPLGGRQAFVRESHGYISSRADLTTLTGQSVRFRFRIGTDQVVDDYGWFVDDVVIYTCGTDGDAPETTITSGPSGPTNAARPTFTFVSDEPYSTFTCRVDVLPWVPCRDRYTAPTLGDGAHTFEVKAKDSANNEDPTPASLAFTVDTDTPETTFLVPPDPNPSTAPTFEFTADEPGTFSCRVDTNPFTLCTSPHTTSPLSPGVHTFEVRATDLAGNVDPSPALHVFTILDTDPPETTIVSGASGSTTDPTPTFEFSSDEPGSTFICRVDSAGFEACTSPHTTVTLANGPHTFEVKAIDSSNNEDPTAASRSFTVFPTSLSIGNAKRREPDKGKKMMTFTVSLSGVSTSPVTVSFATKNGTAKAPRDYKPVQGTLTFAPGTTTAVIKVPIKGDLLDERNERFSVLLSGATGASMADGTGTGTIRDND